VGVAVHGDGDGMVTELLLDLVEILALLNQASGGQ